MLSSNLLSFASSTSFATLKTLECDITKTFTSQLLWVSVVGLGEIEFSWNHFGLWVETRVQELKKLPDRAILLVESKVLDPKSLQ